jgi:prophage antirepressor-like protein
MNDLTVFEFKSNDVRILEINGEYWFVLTDILQALGSATTVSHAKSVLLNTFGDGVVNVIPILDSMEREQKVVIINESATTFLISRSRTELGKSMTRWIHQEVLPSIRKNSFVSRTENNLKAFEKEGLELFIDIKTGESFASISGYARMANKSKSTISERFGKDLLKETQINTRKGLQTVRLIPEDLIVQWLPKDNPEMASNLMRIGVRAFLHKLAGYEVSSSYNTQEEILQLVKSQQTGLNKLLAEKSQKEEYGELITESFTGISKLLQSVLQGVALQYRETLQGLYDKQTYYTLAELSSNLFGENSYRIYCKARCNINGLYQTMTERIIPKDGMNYVFDKDTAVFAVWRLHFAALELGIISQDTFSEYVDVVNELNNLLGK